MLDIPGRLLPLTLPAEKSIIESIHRPSHLPHTGEEQYGYQG